MPTKRRRRARKARISSGTRDWLGTEDARIFFETPEQYDQLVPAPRAAVQLVGYRPWWTFPDWVLAHLRGRMQLTRPPEPEAVAYVQALEAEWLDFKRGKRR